MSDILTIKDEKKEDLIETYKILSELKNGYIKHTCEGIAESAKLKKLIFYCTLDGDTLKQLWETYDDFLNEDRKLLVTIATIRGSEFLSGLSSTILRTIARHPAWRTRWISATKTGCAIFRGEIAEWDANKILLCYWSNMYDSCYGSYEQIETRIIENDELLDNYLESKALERNKVNTTSSSSSGDGVRAVFKPIIAKPTKK